MIITKFDKFINESFIHSKEYSDFLKSEYIINKSFFTDSLMEVNDIPNCSIKFYTNIVDSKGHLINTKLEDKEYKVNYIINISYKTKSDLNSNEFESILENLNTIQISFSEMKDRCLDDNRLKLIDDSVTVGKDQYDHRVENMYKFSVKFESDLDINKLKMYYNQWVDFEDEEYIKGIKELEEIYKKEGIDFYKHMDTNDDETLLQVGFFGDDGELYVIATYNKETKQFFIDEGEVDISIHHYHYGED